MSTFKYTHELTFHQVPNRCEHVKILDDCHVMPSLWCDKQKSPITLSVFLI